MFGQSEVQCGPLSGISMLEWKAVSADAIGHAEFTFGPEPSPELSPATASSNADIIDNLQGCGVPTLAVITLKEFTDVGRMVLSCAKLNNDEVIDQAIPPLNDFDDNVPCAVAPSHIDLIRAFAVLAST